RNMNLRLSILVETALDHVSPGPYANKPTGLHGSVAAGGSGNARNDGRRAADEATPRRGFQLVELHGRLVALLTPGIIRDSHLSCIGGVVVLNGIYKQVVPLANLQDALRSEE